MSTPEVNIFNERPILTNLDKEHTTAPDYATSIKSQLQHISKMTLDDWIGVDDTYGEPKTEFLNIEYIVDAEKAYKHVRLMMTSGGPSVYLHTDTKEVHLHWTGNHYSIVIDSDICEAIDKHFQEIYKCR